MADLFSALIPILGALTEKQPEVLPSQRKGIAGLFGQPKADPITGEVKKTFWDKPGGNVLASLLGTLATGAAGAGLGALVSPGARELGAARGAGYGAGFGLLEDIGLRKAGMGAEATQKKLDLENMKTEAMIGNWKNQANYRDIMSGVSQGRLGLSREQQQRIYDFGNFSKTFKIQFPNAGAEEFYAKALAEFPDVMGQFTPEEAFSLADPVVGQPAKPGFMGVGKKPEVPGVYSKPQKPQGKSKGPQSAEEWLLKNPNDPRATAVKEKLMREKGNR